MNDRSSVASLPLLFAYALLISSLLVLAGCAACTSGQGSPGYTSAQTGHDGLPLHFELNRGQADPQFRFLARGRRFNLYLSANEIILASLNGRARDSALHVRLADSNPGPVVQGQEPLPGKVNYFIGKNPDKWHIGIPTYRRVMYRQVYPGIDVVYYGDQGQLENDFVIAPGGDPSRIRLAFEGRVDKEIDDTRISLCIAPPGRFGGTNRRFTKRAAMARE